MEPAKNSMKGYLLLDGGKLAGSLFHRSVVLICEHNAEGAFGLILNKVSDNKVGEALSVTLPEKLKKQKLLLGGPVQPAALSFLHTDTFVPHANVMLGLNLGHSVDALQEIGESYSTTQQVKVFAGYSGWSPGQLEQELKRGSWLTHPATLELVFSNPRQLWNKILAEKGPLYRLLADAPEDLSWN
jgi:putative transcriptional regulator